MRTKKVFLSSTTVDENLVIRVAILSFRTKKAHIDHLLETIRKAVTEIRK